MDLLDTWLAATIEGELSEALQQWEDGIKQHQSPSKSQGLFFDDDSNLRISSGKKGPVVQITKLLTFGDPIQVTLSDSVVRVNASISNQASQRYAEKYRKKLTEGTVGGLIQLLEFEIVATHLGPRDKRLTLYVKDFKSLGSEGSGVFGFAPQAIESREGTKELLNKLANLRRLGTSIHSGQLTVKLGTESQPSAQASEARDHPDSQAGFATQVPRSVAPSDSKSKSPGSTSGVNIRSISSADSAQSLANPVNVKNVNPLERTLIPLQAKAAPARPTISHGKALLGLLRNRNRAPLAQGCNPDSTIGQSPGQVTASSEPDIGEKENQTSRIVNPIASDANVSRTASEAQKRKRQFSETNPRKKNSRDRDLQKFTNDSESLAVNHALEIKASSVVGAIEASIDTLHSQPTSPLILKSTDSHPNASLEPSFHSTSKAASSASVKKAIRNGISCRDVSIPKDQETLLNRADSWLPAEPGQREPSANIPISLLKRLNQKAAFRAQRQINSGKQGNDSVTPSTVIDRTADSESDVPVSSGQWPASPEPEQLPPDSSMASAEHSDNSATRIINTSRSASPARRPSNASILSSSMPPGLPSPIPATTSFRGSESLGMTSPGAISPSITSTSAGEENHCFGCQIPGCDKSYKRSGSLTAHVNRHHTSAEALESFKGPLKDCIKSYPSPGDLKHHVEYQHDGNPVLSIHSGSASRTTPSASASMSSALRSSSERDGGSGNKITNPVASNEPNSVEVPASLPLLIDERSKNQEDKESSGRPSRMTSELGSSIPPDAMSAPSQTVTTNPDGTYVAQENASSPVPASPTSDSDLELTIPLALKETTDSVPSSAPIQNFPCTAPQPRDPFTQVKRTPYVNGRVQNDSPPASSTISLPLKSNLYPLANGNINDDTEFISASITSSPGMSIAETHDHTRSSHAVEDQNNGKVAARPAETDTSQEIAHSNAKNPDKLMTENQQVKSQVYPVVDSTDNTSQVMTESQRQSLGLDQPTMFQEVNIKRSAVPEKLLTPEGSHRKLLPQLFTPEHAAHFAHEVKRKFADASFASPGVTKRQKRFKVPTAFTFTERSDIRRDPSEGARQYRQDFLASRKSSGSSTPTASPTMSFTFSPGTTPENRRDPAEHARLIMRQEFSASRRSSEISTPTSPRMQLNTLMGTVQAECRNSKTGKDAKHVTMQDQSANTNFECQRRAQLKELSAIPQSQWLNSDAALLSNGTISIETDSDNAKPGAQDNALCDHEADFSVLIPQNAAVEAPNAKRSSVIKASFDSSLNETERARSVELDLSIPLPIHREVADGLAGTTDEANHTINLGAQLNITNGDQFEDRRENSWPVDSEPERAHKVLSTQADEVTEQVAKLPSPRAIFNHVAEPKNAAPEFTHEQRSLKDLDAKIPDQIASEPTSPQQSVAVDVNTQIPDETIMEPVPDQQLTGVDIDTPMADIQVSHDIPSSELTVHSGEHWNQIIPLPSVVSARATDSESENQRSLSSTNLSPVIPLSNAMSGSKVESVKEPQNTIQLPIERTKQELPSVAQSIFNRFKATYPTYPGDMKHFTAICKKICQLVKLNRMVHQSLWDDFIVRHKVDYSQYLRQCAEEAEDAVSYEIFYQTEVEGPQYQNRVINRRTLDEALALFERQPDVERVYVEPIGDDKSHTKQVNHRSTSNLSPVIEKPNHEYSPANKDESLQPRGARPRSRHKPAVSCKTDREPSESRVVIDLTGEDPADDPPKTVKEREITTQSSRLHLVNGVSVERVSLRHCHDSPRGLYQVLSPSPSMRGSHVLPSPRAISPSLVSATASTETPAKRLRRSLPREDSDHGLLQSSPKGKASDSSKVLRVSELREIRAKETKNARDARSQTSANSIPIGPKQSQWSINTCHRVIQSNWGIKAQEVLEPEQRKGQVWSDSMIELLAEIASKTNLDEARNRIRETINTRIGGNTRQVASNASQEGNLLQSDLEVVRGVVATSSMRTTTPSSPADTNAGVEKQSESRRSHWWDDDNSPFKSFARAYASIRPGKGNSFATISPGEPEESEKAEEATDGGVALKKIDITRWEFPS